MSWNPIPVSQSAISDVYKGELDGKKIAIKDLRVHIDSIPQVTKVICSSSAAYV